MAIGIDAALGSTGVVSLDVVTGEVICADTLKPTATGVVRLVQIQELLGRWLGQHDPLEVAHVCMERYGFEGKSGRHSELGEGGGAVKIVLYRSLATPVRFPTLVAPNQVKKYVTGSGAGQKDQMRLGVYKRWGFEHSSNDVVDAYGLAQIARALVIRPVELIGPQNEVLDMLVKAHATYAEMPVELRYELGV